ncbi:MAG: Fic family protein, partial [Fimbriimonadaceae bacterium]
GTLPNAELFVNIYVSKEAVLSSQIEGTMASLAQIMQVEANVISPNSVRDYRVTSNAVKALWHGLNRVGTLPVSLRLFRELHSVLLDGTRGGEIEIGEFRTSQNWIGSHGSTLKTASFIPPAPHEMMQALGDLENFLHSDGLPDLIAIGLAHSQFETIHPFLDGNGRLGRLLITFLLAERKLLKLPLLYLSHYLKQHQQEYYQRLQAVRDHGQWEEWIDFFLRAVATVADEATETVRLIGEIRESDRNSIIETAGRSTALCLTLHEHLFAQPWLTTRSAQHALGGSYTQAQRVVGHLVASGVLQELPGGRRNRAFVYQRYFAVFDVPSDLNLIL